MSISILRTLSLEHWLNPITACLTRVAVGLPILPTHRLPHCEAHTVSTGALPITLCGGPSTGCNTLAGVCLPISSTYRGVYLLAYTPRDSCGGVDRAGTS